MKCKLVLILLFFSIPCYTQFTDYPKFSWEIIDKDVSKEFKDSLISLLIGNEDFNVDYLNDTRNFRSINDAINFRSEEIKSYHIYNINEDPLPDIIFEGQHNSGEGNNVAFFMNDGDSLKIVFNIFGNIESIGMTNKCITQIQTIVLPCCANYITYRNYYTIDNYIQKSQSNNDTSLVFTKLKQTVDFIQIRLDSIEVLNYCQKPNSINKNISFITSDFVYLTFDPTQVINKDIIEPNLGCDIAYLADGNNQVARLKPGSIGTILSEQINQSGDKYFFIKTHNFNTDQSIFENSNFIIYGWAKAEGIKIQ